MNQNLTSGTNLSSSTNISSFKEDENKRLLGFLFWAALIFIGSSLIFYIFVINPGDATYSDTQNYDNGIVINGKTVIHHPRNILNKRNNWIKYDGVMETNANIVFKLNGYDSSAEYLFDFGDGTTKKCRSTKIAHAYSKPGKYTVSVKVRYKNRVEEAWTETLKIKKGIPVDPSAYFN